MRTLPQSDRKKWTEANPGLWPPPSRDRREPDNPRLWFARVPWCSWGGELFHEDLAAFSREQLEIERRRMWLVLTMYQHPHDWHRERLERVTEALRRVA